MPAKNLQLSMISGESLQRQSVLPCYQSFREGEVTAEQAHEIGVKLAEQLWGDRFQVVVATHLNTGHYHNHIMLNAIAFADGYKFVNHKSDYQQMRKVSDDLCREYGLSVIEHPGQSGKHYGEWKAEQEGRPDSSVAIFAWIWMLPLKSWAANQLTDPDDQRCVEIYGWTSMQLPCSLIPYKI